MDRWTTGSCKVNGINIHYLRTGGDKPRSQTHRCPAPSLKNKGSKIVVDKGQIVKVSKDKDGKAMKAVLTKHWTDWVDYSSVDFDYENKREIIRVRKDMQLEAQA